MTDNSTKVIGQVYPWDLADGPARAVMLREAGVHDVAVAASYHAVRAVRWTDNGRPVVMHAPRSAWYLPLDSSRWDDLRPGAAEIGDATAFAASLDAAQAAGLGARAWLVLTHDDERIALERPDLATVDAWGNVSRYALCPSQPEVRSYCRNMVLETVRLTGLTQLLVESVTPPGYLHSIGHDKTEHADLDPALLTSLSLCCCVACVAEASADGWDLPGYAARLREAAPVDLTHPLHTRARVAFELATALAVPAGQVALEITVAATSTREAFGAFAPMPVRPPGIVGLCADLSTEQGWHDLAWWSHDRLTRLAGTLPLRGRSVAASLVLPGPWGPRPELHELYLYHLGMRHPDALNTFDLPRRFAPRGEA